MNTKVPFDDRIVISNVIASVRDHGMMTQKQFGDAVGVKSRQVSRYESAAAIPRGNILKAIFRIGLKIAAPHIHKLPGRIPAVLTPEVIDEITKLVSQEREQEEIEKARIEEITTKLASQIEEACQARDNKGI